MIKNKEIAWQFQSFKICHSKLRSIRPRFRNKKGWIRIVEAFIAVLLIAAILLTVYANQPKTIENDKIIGIEDSLLAEISQKENLRNEVIVNRNADEIETFIRDRVPANLDFKAEICAVNATCAIDSYKQEVYSRDRIISSTLEQYSPQRLRIFMWVKS